MHFFTWQINLKVVKWRGAFLRSAQTFNYIISCIFCQAKFRKKTFLFFFPKKVLTRCGKCAKIIGATMVTLRRFSNFVKLKNKQKSKKFLCKLHKKSRNSSVTRTPVRFTALKRWSIKVPNQSRPNICSRICSPKSVKPPAPHMAPFYVESWPHICQVKIPKRQNPVHMHLQNNKNYVIIIIENKERRRKIE